MKAVYFHSFFDANSGARLDFLVEAAIPFEVVDYVSQVDREHRVRAVGTLIAINDNGDEIGRYDEFGNWSSEALQAWYEMMGGMSQ